MANTATEVNSVSNLTQMTNGILAVPYKWFSLQANVLDGTYHPIDSSGVSQIGWWGTSLSDALGVLSSAPSITIPIVISLHAIEISGDPLLNEFPVDFTVKLYKASSLLTTITVTANAQVLYKNYLSVVYDVDTIVITVTKINRASRTVKIIQSVNLFEVHRVDTLKPKNTEIDTIGTAVYSSDIIKPKNTEIDSLQVGFTRSDILLPKDTETDTLQVKFTRADTLLPKDTETDTLQVKFTRADTLLPKDTEADSLSVNFVRSDTLLPKDTEADSLSVNFVRSDTLLPKDTETDILSVNFVRSDVLLPKDVPSKFFTQYAITRYDTLLPKIAETKSVKNSLASSDVVLANCVESKLVTNKLTRPDNLTPNTAFISPPISNTFMRSDSLLSKLVETKTIKNSFIRQDTLLAKLIDTSTVGIGIYSRDTVLLKSVGKGGDIMASFTSVDNIKVIINELKGMTNVHTRMDEDCRKIYGKVEITYSDPFVDTTITATSSEHGLNTSVDKVMDNFDTPEFKWFSLHDNKLDGSYNPMPTLNDENYHAGWWSNALSNALGVLVGTPTLSIFFGSRPIYYLKVIGDSLLDNYPVDFTIQVKDAANQVIYTETVVGNTMARWYKNLDTPLLNTTSMILTIQKINKPNQAAKIMEFFTSVIETYYDDEIVSINVFEELDYIEPSITLGSVSSNEIDIILDNSTRKFNATNAKSTVHSLLKRNRKVKAWLGTEIVSGEIEWYPLGVFYTTQWNVPDRSLTATLTARDILDVLSYSDFEISIVYQNYNLGQLFEIVLNDGGVTSDEYFIDSSLYTINIPYTWFDKMSHRDALQRLTSCAFIQMYCDRNGKIMITNMEPTPTVFYTFDDDLNVVSKDYPFAWNQITNYVEVKASNYVPDASAEVLKTTESIALMHAQVAVLTYSFNVLPVIEIDPPVLTAGAGIVIDNVELFAWGVVITVRNTNPGLGLQWITGISITGKTLKVVGTSVLTAKDIASMREEGTQKTTIAHEFIQDSIYAQSLADNLLAAYKESRHDVSMECRGDIGLYLGQQILVTDTDDQSTPYVVKRQNLIWDGGLEATVEGKRLS
jgi:hypothetical protein